MKSNSPVSGTAPGFTPEETAFFRDQGYLICRGLVGDDLRNEFLRVTRDGLERLIPPIEFEADLHYPGAPESRTAAGGRTVRRLKQAHSRTAAFTDWLASPSLYFRLAQLLGPDLVAPLAHHNCIMTKNPRFSSDTGWHQDIRYWSFTRPELISVWLALGEEREENGCLWLVPGSHSMSFTRSCFDDEMFFRPDHPENADLLSTKVKAELSPGDVLFFHCRTLHAASRNFTAEPKFSVVLTVRPADNPPISGSRSASSPELLLHPPVE